MKLLKNEEELSTKASLILTTKRLIQEKKELGRRTHKEIPIKNITSISFEYNINILSLMIGIIFALLGFFLTIIETQYTQLWIYMSLFGLIIIVFCILLKKEYVDFKSNSLTIREEKREIEKFVDLVREEIYNI